jgi:Flp pilus assembly pilin Flp
MPKTIAEDKAMTKLHPFLRCNIRRFLADCSGTTAIEYGLIGVIVATGILVAVNLLGTQATSLYQRIADVFPT